MSQRKKKKKEEKKGGKERNSEQVNERGQLSKLRWDGTSDLVLAKAPLKEGRREKRKEERKKKKKKRKKKKKDKEREKDRVRLNQPRIEKRWCTGK